MEKLAKQGPDYKSALAVEKAVDVLFCLAQNGEMSLGDAAKAVGIGRSAAHRILTALKRKELVEQPTENGKYSLSWAILELARPARTAADLRSVALPLMTALRDVTGETATLNVRSRFSRVCIDQIESTHEIRWRSEIGRVSPLYAGATGRVFLAYLDEAERAAYFEQVKLSELTPYTVLERDELERQLVDVRRDGVALAAQDRVLGVAGISAPIFEGARATAALTIAGPSDRCTLEVLKGMIEPLLAATAEISTVMGHQLDRLSSAPTASEDRLGTD